MRRSGLVAAMALVVATSPALTPTAWAGTEPAAAVATVAAGMTPQQAVDEGAAEAADDTGATTYAAVIDRRTGKVVARTDNADTEVASESLVKVLLAAYYLVKYNGDLPADIGEDLHTMIVESDDHLCSAYWTDLAVPAMAKRYDLDGVELAENPGHWGATRVTALGMAEFLYRMSNDPVVGPWLVHTMIDSHDYGSDGFDQNFGFNALQGAASKQGWGSDNYWHQQQNAVHSIGLTRSYAAAVLQTGPSGVYKSLRPLASVTARLIAGSTPPALPDPPAATGNSRTTTTSQVPPSSVPSPTRSTEQPGATVDWWTRALSF